MGARVIPPAGMPMLMTLEQSSMKRGRNADVPPEARTVGEERKVRTRVGSLPEPERQQLGLLAGSAYRHHHQLPPSAGAEGHRHRVAGSA